jgi:hypothetical protein
LVVASLSIYRLSTAVFEEALYTREPISGGNPSSAKTNGLQKVGDIEYIDSNNLMPHPNLVSVFQLTHRAEARGGFLSRLVSGSLSNQFAVDKSSVATVKVAYSDRWRINFEHAVKARDIGVFEVGGELDVTIERSPDRIASCPRELISLLT